MMSPSHLPYRNRLFPVLLAMILSACGGSGGDSPPTTPTVSIDSASIAEGDSGTTNLNFTVSLSNTATNNVTVDTPPATAVLPMIATTAPTPTP